MTQLCVVQVCTVLNKPGALSDHDDAALKYAAGYHRPSSSSIEAALYLYM